MIPIEAEPKELAGPNERGGYELCEFCHEPTKMWHADTNNPVCVECAKVHKVDELVNHYQTRK